MTTAELRQVIPAKPINAVTLRVSEGKCVLLGGLATVELMEGRPFFFTFFVSNEVKLHPTDATRALEFVQKHAGGLVTPPASPQRLEELGPFKVGGVWYLSSYSPTLSVEAFISLSHLSYFTSIRTIMVSPIH